MELPVNYEKINQSERKKVREKYVRIQGGKCHLCWMDLKGPIAQELRYLSINKDLFPSGFFRHPVHLHHDHKTGMTIGAVHCDCNAISWQYHGE